MKLAPSRWIWPLSAVSSVSLLLYVASVAHAGKPVQAQPGSNGTPRYFTPGPAPFAMPGRSPYVVPAPGLGQGPQVTPRLLLTPDPQADAGKSVDHCLVTVRDVDPHFIVTPKVMDQQMIVAPAV